MKGDAHGYAAMTARKIAYCAVMTALITGAQAALGFISGVEVVTLLFVCFSACAGVICGVVTALSFTLLRCFIWGFYPTAIVLYLIYYPLLALVFGLLGKIKEQTFDEGRASIAVAVNILLAAVCALSLCCCLFELIKVSKLYQATAYALTWAIFGISAALIIAFNAVFIAVKKGKCRGRILATFLYTSVACIMTICFTLLDDIITPLMLGMTARTALGYFYSSFIAMLPQTICTLATVSLLSPPLLAIMRAHIRR